MLPPYFDLSSPPPPSSNFEEEPPHVRNTCGKPWVYCFVTQTKSTLWPLPLQPPPFCMLGGGGEGTNFSVALRGMTIFSVLGREVTFWGKYLHWGTIFLRQILFYFIFFLILWSSAKVYLIYKTFFTIK